MDPTWGIKDSVGPQRKPSGVKGLKKVPITQPREMETENTAERHGKNEG